MKFKKSKAVAIGALMVSTLAMEAWAVGTPFDDGFERYASNTPLTSLVADGWTASSNAVVVLTTPAVPVAAGTNAVLIPTGTTATNLVQAAVPVTLWTDVRINEATRMLDGITVDVDTNAILQVFLKTNGAVTVYDRAVGQWLSYSNDAWGNCVTNFVPAGWARVSVLKHYATRKADVFLNGHLMRSGLDFINTNRTTFAGFTLDGCADNPAYLDAVWVADTPPADLTTDVDADGFPDALEWQTYGTMEAWGRVVSNSITLSLANVTNASLAVTGGVTVTVSGTGLLVPGAITVAAGNILILTNVAVTAGSITIGAGGYVQVYNGTATVNGVSYAGTFTLDSSWDGGVVKTRLNALETFESYGVNARVDMLGAFGWAASSPSAVIESNTTYGGSARAVLLPADAAITNLVSAAGLSNVWTDCMLQESSGMVDGEFGSVDSNAVVQLYLNTNRFVVLYNRPAGFWEICSNDVWGASMAGVYAGGWCQVTVNQNYGTKMVAVFLNGHLVREQVPFINTNQGSYASFRLEGTRATPAYVDNVSFTTNVPSGLTGDRDGDGVPDANEIMASGSVTTWPRGSVFKIR